MRKTPFGLALPLVAYYPFNGNANDESGNENHGKIHGATITQDRLGNTNSAYSFDGVNNYVNGGANTSLNITGDITISFWFNSVNVRRKQAFIVKGNWRLDRCYALDLWRKCLNFSYNSGIASSTPSLSIENHRWYYVAVILNSGSGTLTFYLNGVVVHSTTANGISTVNNQILTIGIAEPLSTIPFHGKLDDVCLYNRALKAREVVAYYNAEKRK